MTTTARRPELPGTGQRPEQVDRPFGTLSSAWVESPLQLLGAVEARHCGYLPHGTVVFPRAGLPALTRTVSTLDDILLPAGVRMGSAARRPGRPTPTWVVGDAYSGLVQQTLLYRSPRQLVLLDDGHATRAMLETLTTPRAPLIRPLTASSPTRRALGAATATRIRSLAAAGRVRVVTALQLPPSLVAAAEAIGIQVYGHRFAWLGSLPPAAPPPTRTIVLGTALVANGLLAVRPYLSWVLALAAGEPVTYLPHRREDERTLARLRVAPHVRLGTGELPVELGLRGLGRPYHVFTLPSTAASTLPLTAPELPITEFPVPDSWWTPSASPGARRRIVPRASVAPLAA